MQENTSTIEELGVLAEEVYKNDYFLSNNPDSIVDNERLEYSYEVIATESKDSGFQGMLLRNMETNEYVFAFRGTQGNELSLEMVKDLIIADFAYMGTGAAPQQMKDAMLFVHEMMLANKNISSTNTTFTGHSLGGAIAGMASYVYGFDAYTYNGFGIQNMLWDADDISSVDHPKEIIPMGQGVYQDLETLGEYLESLDVTVQKSTAGIVNIVQEGYAYEDIVGGILTDIVSGQAIPSSRNGTYGFPYPWNWFYLPRAFNLETIGLATAND